MGTLMEILAGWILVSRTGGPLFTWAFFYPERRMQAARDYWIATHPLQHLN